MEHYLKQPNEKVQDRTANRKNNQMTDELSSLSALVPMAKFNFTKHDLFLDFYSKDFFKLFAIRISL